MYTDPDLENIVTNSPTIHSKGAVFAEWNMNDPDNFLVIGNYRNRWHRTTGNWRSLTSMFDKNDTGNWYTGATAADVEVFGYNDETDEPEIFIEPDTKWAKLFSLDDCLGPNRPRSGINYPIYLTTPRRRQYIDGVNPSANRPRYYPADPDSQFKYWTSFRREGGEEFGVSYKSSDGTNPILDSTPFVVYKSIVPANKLVVKMQTNIGTELRGPFSGPSGTFTDPLTGAVNATTPKRWGIEVLKNNVWTRVKTFQENEVRSDGSPVVAADGYVQLDYGIIIPNDFTGPYRYLGVVANASMLPDTAYPGDYFLEVQNEGEVGIAHIWSSGSWQTFVPQYGWYLNEDESLVGKTQLSDFVSPPSFTYGGNTLYREFEYIQGIRVVVYTMNVENCTFDLIEMSPRLVAEVTNMTESFSAKKSIGRVDDLAVPIGGLQAGTGSITMFDTEHAFKDTNTNSIIKDYLNSNIAFSFYELIEDENKNYYIPVKKMYTEGKYPNLSDYCTVSYELRDAFYILENNAAPSIMIRNVSLSYAVMLLLDSIGFSNYVFLRDATDTEPVIPYFFVASDKNVAEILESLAIATQSAMYFDEYNNFVVMYKNYMMGTRDADVIFDGTSSVPNIVDVASTEKKVFNGGTITYTERYIQRAIGKLRQANFVNQDESWIYLPSLLWEASGDDSPRTVNDKVAQQSNYALGAVPLATNLTADVPRVSSGKIINNVINIGENSYWLPRYSGYLYSSGEIIKFDAVEYNVGNASVWISSNDEYQRYFADLGFNQKMYPTGNVRIFCEPYVDSNYNIINGAVAKHGRGQFGTTITAHYAGLNSYWTSNSNTYGIHMESKLLFDPSTEMPTTVNTGNAGKQYSGTTNISDDIAKRSWRRGVMKNFFRDVNYSEAEMKNITTAQSGIIQASALYMDGPSIPPGQKAWIFPRDFVSYVHKSLDSGYQHFGTRMRVIGKLESASDIDQTPSGAVEYYSSTVGGDAVILNGGSGGIGIGVNPTSNMGYYFELIALSSTNLQDMYATSDSSIHNVLFYKVVKAQDTGRSAAIPVKLWGGTAEVLVDAGTFAGQGRLAGEDKTTVYDLSIEYEPLGKTALRFHLFINGKEIATVDDYKPIRTFPLSANVCLFVRGTSSIMFENIYALRNNIATNTNTSVIEGLESTVKPVFGQPNIPAKSWQTRGLSGIIQNSYLSGIKIGADNKFMIYYDEFGAIMRECAYFDVKYDRAFPALTAQMSPPTTDSPAYTVSGFTSDPYGAKFLVFNVTDKTVSLDETTGNYLRIQGITFTQSTDRDLTMDNHLNKVGEETRSIVGENDAARVALTEKSKDKLKQIKISRMKYGKTDWNVESQYIQTQASAEYLMDWLIDKTTRPRTMVGISVFGNPLIQLGDVGSINYVAGDVDIIAPSTKKFVVYNIEYSRNAEGPETTIYLSEV